MKSCESINHINKDEIRKRNENDSERHYIPSGEYNLAFFKKAFSPH